MSFELCEADAARFWPRVEKTDTCWLWHGTLMRNGYGTFTVRGPLRRQMAHHLTYRLDGRAIPEGYLLDHICRVRNCVNPDHLRPLTNRENVLLGIGPTAINAQKTYCSKGHEFTPENTWRDRRGGRRCRTCHNESERVRRLNLKRQEVSLDD